MRVFKAVNIQLLKSGRLILPDLMADQTETAVQIIRTNKGIV